MKIRFAFFITISLIIFTACESNSKSKNIDFINKENTNHIENLDVSDSMLLPSTLGDDRVYYVNRNGDDPHNTFQVYRSITEALKNIVADINYSSMLDNPFSYKDVTLIIQEGIYGEESNETYPLIFPENMKIKGEGNVIIKNLDYLLLNIDKDVTTLLHIIFANDYEPLIILKNNVILDSVNLYAGDGIGVMIENNNSAILKNSNIFKSEIGIKTKDNSKIVMMNSDIYDNVIGIEVSDNSEANIKGVKIFNNQIGLKTLQSSKLQFADKNLIKENTLCGLYDKGIGNDLVLSDQIEWDVPYVYDDCQNGVSIASDKNRNIIFQFLPEYIKLFSNVPEVGLIYPKHNSSITTTSPNIKWTPTPDNINTRVIIMNSLPIVNNNQIINIEDTVWYWDSASNPRKLGNVSYADGQFKGKLLNGKGYYYVVLEMNKAQTKVTAASLVNFFTVVGTYTK